MTRRGLLGALAALGASVPVWTAAHVAMWREQWALTRQDAPGTTIAPPRWGPVDVERHRVLAASGVHLRVYDRAGREVTNCYFADDTGDGVAHRFKENAHGQRYFDRATRKPARETVVGITLVAGAPF